MQTSPKDAILVIRQIAQSNNPSLIITLYSEQIMTTKRYHVTRVRHQLEGTVIEAGSPEEAIEKSRKTKRKAWNHIDSKRRRSYKADEVHTRIKAD